MNNLEIVNNEELRITSVELVDKINEFREMEGTKAKLRHDSLMTKIRKEQEVLELAGLGGQQNILESSYINSQNKNQPCYKLNQDAVMNLLMSESVVVRARVIKYVRELENQLKDLIIPSYQIADPVKRAEKWIEEQKEKQLLLEDNKEKELKIEKQVVEIEHKEDVIIGLTDNIDLATKRQRITQIIRYGANGRYPDRYSMLYKEFELKYHIDLYRRLNNAEVKKMKPKVNTKMKYIDTVMNKIPELYEICCKLFETDVDKLKQQWDDTIRR